MMQKAQHGLQQHSGRSSSQLTHNICCVFKVGWIFFSVVVGLVQEMLRNA